MAKTVDHCIDVHIALFILFTGRDNSSKNIYLFSVSVSVYDYILYSGSAVVVDAGGCTGYQWTQ